MASISTTTVGMAQWGWVGDPLFVGPWSLILPLGRELEVDTVSINPVVCIVLGFGGSKEIKCENIMNISIKI